MTKQLEALIAEAGDIAADTETSYKAANIIGELIAVLGSRKNRHPAATIYKNGNGASVVMIGSDLPDGYSDVYAEMEASPLAVRLPESFYPNGDIDCPKVVEVEEVIEAIRAAGGTVEGA